MASTLDRDEASEYPDGEPRRPQQSSAGRCRGTAMTAWAIIVLEAGWFMLTRTLAGS